MNAIITGASRGIGRAICESLAKENINLAICARTEADLLQTKRDLLQINPSIEILTKPVDLSIKEEVKEFTAYIKKQWSEVDILVNNAGIFMPGTITEEPEDNLLRIMDINLYSAYYITREIVPIMKRQRSGHIFNMCSIASIVAYANGASYGISKFALLGFSKVLREELKPSDIKVTAVLPGATLTDTWDGVDIPEERFIRPEDIATAVLSAFKMSKAAVVEEILIRPQSGDV